MYLGRPKLAVLGELEEALREMVWGAVECAVAARGALQEVPRGAPGDAHEAR